MSRYYPPAAPRLELRFEPVEHSSEDLQQCEYEEPESHWGQLDGGERCTSDGVVHGLNSDLDLCLIHFRLMDLL